MFKSNDSGYEKFMLIPDKAILWKDKSTRFRYRFCKVKGNIEKAKMLERVYDDLDGGIKNNYMSNQENVWAHYAPAKDMFESGPAWSMPYNTRADTPSIFCGYTGWFPYFNPFLRRALRNTLLSICAKQRKDGCFPIYQAGECKTEQGVIVSWGLQEYKVDDYIDGHMCAIINFCEDILFTRDIVFAKKMIPRLRKAIQLLMNRKFKNYLMEVGYGGAFIELWYSYVGYPTTSQIFYIRALQLMAEVEKFLNNNDNAEKYLSSIPDTKKALMQKLFMKEGFFMGTLDINGKHHGDGKDYFESIPNVIVGPLEVVDESHAKSIVKKIKTIPQLDCEVPMVVNYPGRWENFNPKVEGRGVGNHWNGGAWLCFGGFEIWTHLIAKDYEKAERLINHVNDYRKAYGLQDFVGNFGRFKGMNISRQGFATDHPLNFQHGAFGNTLRGLLGIQPYSWGIELMPRIFPDIKEIEFKKPIYYGGKEIYISIKNGTTINKVMVNGNSIKDFDEHKIILKYEDLPAKRCLVCIKYS